MLKPNHGTTPIWASLPETLHSDPADPLPEYDAVVVGAGIVGLTTALLAVEQGMSVAVLEARYPGAGTTGRSTAKGTVLQGALASRIAARHGTSVAAAYVHANRAGLDLLREHLQAGDVPWRPAAAWSYATQTAGAEQLRAEVEVLAGAGVPALLAEAEELPFKTELAVRLDEQVQLDPAAYTAWLLRQVQARGVPVTWPMRATGVAENRGGQLLVDATGEAGTARLRARWVVVATLLPFPLRTALFAAAAPSRSYIVATTPQQPVPAGMYLSVGPGPTRSLRSATDTGGQELLLVGGGAHPTGKRLPASHHLRALTEWAQQHFRTGPPNIWWSAQDYSSADLLPHIGSSPFGPSRLLLATGLGKWGMTNGTAAAIALVAQMRDQVPPWVEPMRPRLAHGIVGAGRLAMTNLSVGLGLAKGWVWDPDLRDGGVAQGDGRVLRRKGVPVAVSNAAGLVRACSAVCTHLGGVVRWNDVERSWDCPLHGSRFDPAGEVLDGPAVEPLEPAALPTSTAHGTGTSTA